MTVADPLQLAISAYTSANWDEENWRQFGRETGTSDLIAAHPRLYRSLSFGDDDYPDAVFEVWGTLLREATEPSEGESGRMELVADSAPDLPRWIEKNGPIRTKRVFARYLLGRADGEVPLGWQNHTESDEANAENETAHRPFPTNHSSSATQTHWGPPVTDGSGKSDPNTWDSGKFSEWGTSGWENTTPPWDTSQDSTVKTGDFSTTNQPLTFSPEKTPTNPGPFTSNSPEASDSIFIVHGHDTAASNSIRLFVHDVLGAVPTSLADEPAQGRTIIEKFEEVANTSARVIVLMTPDDLGESSGLAQNGQLRPRARQNVVLELGYFIGKLGRSRVIVINAGVEIPSDISGFNYVAYPGENWKHDLRRELEQGI